MNTVEALKELYKSFGGKLTDTYSNIADGIPVGNYSVIPDCFAALAEIAGGSIELPAVTSSDNGSVLSVVDGAWAKGLKIKSGEAKVTVPSEGTNMTLDFELWKGYGDAIEKKIFIGCTLAYLDINPLAQNTPFEYKAYAKTSAGQNSQNVRVSGLDTSISFTNGHEYTLKYYYIEF